jgi:hypothetical protein
MYWSTRRSHRSSRPAGADALLPSELAEVAAQRSGGHVTVIALDATWANARRMAGWYPRGVSAPACRQYPKRGNVVPWKGRVRCSAVGPFSGRWSCLPCTLSPKSPDLGACGTPQTLQVRLPPESTLREHKVSLLRPVRCGGGVRA